MDPWFAVFRFDNRCGWWLTERAFCYIIRLYIRIVAESTGPIMEEVNRMHSFYATSDRRLGLCLRMLNAEGISKVSVESNLNDRDKTEYFIWVKMSQKYFDELQKRYTYMIS